MSNGQFSSRFSEALRKSGLSPSELAAKVGTTDATISNWQNDKVQIDHVKAALLLKISAAINIDPYALLFGDKETSMGKHVRDNSPAYLQQSQVLKPETLKLAIQLASEQLDNKGLTLPPEKHAELVTLMYELLDEGLPEAKVLRFARVTAA